jgi:hypothetical protein
MLAGVKVTSEDAGSRADRGVKSYSGWTKASAAEPTGKYARDASDSGGM